MAYVGPKVTARHSARKPREARDSGTPSASVSTEMRTEVELFPARFEGDRLRYRASRQACSEGTDPDATARSLMSRLFPDVPLRRVLIHSTSWRYEHDCLTLTYLAYSDDLPFGDLQQVLPRDAKAVGAGIASVVAHAIRHLAFLARQDPDLYARAISPETLAHLMLIEPEVAGRIYRERAA